MDYLFGKKAMQIQFWSVGKNHDQYVAEGIADFTKRINNYFTTSWKIIPPVKNASSLSEAELKKERRRTNSEIARCSTTTS